jgi:flavodoxin I
MEVGIIFGSTTGTTEKMGQMIKQQLEDHGRNVVLKNVSDTKPDDLEDYDIVLLGSSTWGDGELQQDFVTFQKELEGMDLSGKKAACFGPGMTVYPQFCKAVDILEETIRSCGAVILSEGLKIDGNVEENEDQITAWADGLIT